MTHAKGADSIRHAMSLHTSHLHVERSVAARRLQIADVEGEVLSSGEGGSDGLLDGVFSDARLLQLQVHLRHAVGGEL